MAYTLILFFYVVSIFLGLVVDSSLMRCAHFSVVLLIVRLHCHYQNYSVYSFYRGLSLSGEDNIG